MFVFQFGFSLVLMILLLVTLRFVPILLRNCSFFWFCLFNIYIILHYLNYYEFYTTNKQIVFQLFDEHLDFFPLLFRFLFACSELIQQRNDSSPISTQQQLVRAVLKYWSSWSCSNFCIGRKEKMRRKTRARK